MADGVPVIPIGPIVGVAIGLGVLAATTKITRDALEHAKERETMRPHPIFRSHPIERKEGQSDIDSRINKMLGRTK